MSRRLIGLNFSYIEIGDLTIVDMFGTTVVSEPCSGTYPSNYLIWTHRAGTSAAPTHSIAPYCTMALIRRRLALDQARGVASRIGQIQLSPYGVLGLLNENILWFRHFKQVIETEDYIDIPQVNFDGHRLTVRVNRYDQSVLDVASADVYGVAV